MIFRKLVMTLVVVVVEVVGEFDRTDGSRVLQGLSVSCDVIDRNLRFPRLVSSLPPFVSHAP